ncbi:hypothetical protein A0U40_18600 [[Bacillus] sp. KCTC 13219]|nr:hypothetical protein A0U40_18600 [[Bacillus] sp. KCTC 13219]
MEITHNVRSQILTFAKHFTGESAEAMHLHKFANKPGYMLTIETRNAEGFLLFLQWLEKIECPDVVAIRTLPEEHSIYDDYEQKSLAFFEYMHGDFKIATEVSQGRIINMINKNHLLFLSICTVILKSQQKSVKGALLI